MRRAGVEHLRELDQPATEACSLRVYCSGEEKSDRQSTPQEPAPHANPLRTPSARAGGPCQSPWTKGAGLQRPVARSFAGSQPRGVSAEVPLLDATQLAG